MDALRRNIIGAEMFYYVFHLNTLTKCMVYSMKPYDTIGILCFSSKPDVIMVIGMYGRHIPYAGTLYQQRTTILMIE